jgi:hypothetical protein
LEAHGLALADKNIQTIKLFTKRLIKEKAKEKQ